MNELTKILSTDELTQLVRLTDIHSWADFRREFLLGEGKATNTIAAYETAAKQFYDFCEGLHPADFRVRNPERIESFYDSLTCSLDTKALKMCGLKYLYKRIASKLPVANPFDTMNEVLSKKLTRTTKDTAERGALSRTEYQAICRMLKTDISPIGLRRYAAFRFGCSSGLRAHEIVGLTIEDISDVDGELHATFIGKGQKRRTVPVEKTAYQLMKRICKSGRIFPVTKATIHNDIKAIVSEAVERGILRSNLQVSTHTMRHTAATQWLAAGASLDVVQRWLGHSSLATTQRYLHSTCDANAVFAKMSEAAA